MKKIATLIIISTLTLSGVALAKSDNNLYQGGFSGPSSQSVTVSQAQRMADDINVTLTGYITQQLNDKKEYLFKDDTGTIQVEIKDYIWNGLTVTPNDLVEISGEIDKDWTSVELEVKQIRKINN